MNTRLSNISSKLLIFIFLTFPFWEVLSAQLNYFIGVPTYLIGTLKYSILLLLVFLLLINLFNRKLVINSESFLILAYTLFILLHFVGSSHIVLKVDGFRYEVLFPLLAFLLLSQQNIKIININFLISIIFIQGFIIFFIAIIEYFNQDILSILYRKSLSDIPHINWFSLNRLISTVGNPINLGASLIIWTSTYVYTIRSSTLRYIKYLFPIVLLINLFLISMTLSRTSLIAYVLIILISFIFTKSNLKNKLLIGALIVLLISYASSYVINSINTDLLLKRFNNIFSSSEYLENARFSNWKIAFSSLDNFEYIWGKGLGASTANIDDVLKYNGLLVENGFISIIINYGPIGLILFLALYLRFIKISLLIRKKNETLGMFFISFIIIYSIFNLANDYNRNLPYALYFWIFYYYAEVCYKKTLQRGFIIE